MTALRIASCPVCASDQIHEVLDIEGVPIYCNVLLPTREEALQVPRGDMRLRFCGCCGHVFNAAFDPGRLDYTPDYENSLHCSPRFQRYAENLAADLIERHALRGKRIVEIACGKGDFLKLLCRLGGNRGIGFDPSCEDEGDGGDIIFVRDYFGGRKASAQADFVCCRHALEHIGLPTEFLQGVKEAIEPSNSTVLFFEVPNGLYTVRDLGIWDLIYEHCSYFWEGSLRRAFELAGFRVTRLQVEFEGQFIGIEGRVGQRRPDYSQTVPGLEAVSERVAAFRENYRRKVDEWHNRLTRLKAAGTRVVVWGGGSKGVTFLNVAGMAGEIDYLVDLNPKKQNRFVPGTGQRVVAPEFLIDYAPEVIIVMNPAYREEIESSIAGLGVGARILAA